MPALEPLCERGTTIPRQHPPSRTSPGLQTAANVGLNPADKTNMKTNYGAIAVGFVTTLIRYWPGRSSGPSNDDTSTPTHTTLQQPTARPAAPLQFGPRHLQPSNAQSLWASTARPHVAPVVPLPDGTHVSAGAPPLPRRRVPVDK